MFTAMYREQRIRSLRELRETLGSLDEDEGIRIYGRARGLAKGGLIFTGVYMGRYCVRVADRVWDRRRKTFNVGRKSKYFYFDRFDEMWSFLKSIIGRPLRAWLY